MFPSLYRSTKLTVGLTLGAYLVNVLAVSQAYMATPVLPSGGDVIPHHVAEELESADIAEVIKFQPDVLDIAHHGGEGGGGMGATVTAAPVLAGVAVQSRMVGLSDSLWGNLLLDMAYRRDPEIQQLARKLGHVNTFTLLSVAGVSALGLAQSISALDNVRGSQTLNVVSHHGGPPHVHTEPESKGPATMGIVGGAATLATLGVRGVMNHRYRHRLESRQTEIQTQLDGLLTRLESGDTPESIMGTLAPLVGERAAVEFAALWRATH